MIPGHHAVRHWRPEVTPTRTSLAQTLRRKRGRVLSTSPRRSRTISTGSRRTSKLPSECGGVLRLGPTRQVTTARLLAKEERHTREDIGLQSLAPVLSSTWSSSLLLFIGGYTTEGAYERTLVQRNQLFTKNIEAARCVLLAPHRIPLKEFTTRRKKPENRGGLDPVWGYPWVCPENCQSWGAAGLLFWKWVASHSYSQEKLRELQQDLLLSYIQDQRNLQIEFAHLVSKRLLPKDFQKRAASSAQGERGYELYASAPIPRSGKKTRTTHEAAAASVPRSRQPSGSQPGAAQSAPTSSVSRGIPATSPGAGAFHQGAARGRPPPRGSGSLHYGRGEVEEPSFDFEYEVPPAGRSSRLSALLATVTQPQNAEVDRLRQRVLVLEIALGLGTGGDAAAQAGNRGVLAKPEDRLHQLDREISGLHDRVGRRAPSSDVDEAFRQLQQVRGALRDLAPRTETHSYGYAQPYSQPYGYGGYSAYPAGAQPYGAPPAYQTPRGPPMPRGSWPYAAGRSTTSEADSRFEELGPPPRGTPVASGEPQAPAGHDTASDDPHKMSGASSST
ncbi:hypothetical protein PC121_g7128 [Phytophthora cactorum]|nr:hypothetical protein PC121_g7128 [Phytophthora cactorum]KAG4045975.1 hypothetical protein PC123_g18643 [Phytophthora cactorum]